MAEYRHCFWLSRRKRVRSGARPKTMPTALLHKHLSATSSNNKHSTAPCNCHPAVGAPSLPVQHGRAAGHPLETGHHCDVTPRIRLTRRARRAPTDRPALTQGRTARWLAGVRDGESHMYNRVGWAGAFDAPSRGRCGMVHCVCLAVETVAARRSM